MWLALLTLAPALACDPVHDPSGCVLQPLLPDLEVLDVTDAFWNGGPGCDAQGRLPLDFTVRNHGANPSAATWLDVFFDLPAAPEVGDVSAHFVRVPSIPPLGTITVRLWMPASEVPDPEGSLWIDAVVDTFDGVDEEDETNNVSSWFSYLSCYHLI